MTLSSTSQPTSERLRRWRLVLGGGDADGICGSEGGESAGISLTIEDKRMDDALGNLYDAETRGRNVGMGASAPKVSRWLADLREFFPTDTVRVMQQDAIERLNLTQLLFEPEMLDTVEADVHLVSTLLTLKGVMPAKAKDAARNVVRKVVEDLTRKLEEPTRAAVSGSLNRAQRNYRPRQNEIDWNSTIRKNLKNYLPDKNTVIPEKLVGYGRAKRQLKAVTLCLDQSGSMGSSIVYAGIFGAVLASLPALKTNVVVYDTAVVDLTEHLSDPVDVLFGVQLGGGNDTPLALRYCRDLLTNPEEHTFVLISDLYEGYGSAEMIRRLHEFVDMGVRVIVLLALDDNGTPSFDHANAAALAAIGIPVFACTPAHFPDLMATAISGGDIAAWAGQQGIVTRGGAAG